MHLNRIRIYTSRGILHHGILKLCKSLFSTAGEYERQINTAPQNKRSGLRATTYRRGDTPPTAISPSVKSVAGDRLGLS